MFSKILKIVIAQIYDKIIEWTVFFNIRYFF